MLALAACGQSSPDPASAIIPLPQSVQATPGEFRLHAGTVLVSGDREVEAARYLNQYIEGATGTALQTTQQPRSDAIELSITPALADSLGEEGYLLAIDTDGVTLKAAAEAGLFYAVQSLRQLLPTAYEYQNSTVALDITLPGLSISDRPRFHWRGLMLDEARHFQGKAAVMKLLEQMALLKMNRFHWHLTDYQGWRIEIKKYPRLTEIGAYRKDTEIGEPLGWGSGEYSGEPHGGYYSQEDIREIVRFAARLHIKVIPEIEMPGHSAAAIAAYPWLGFSETPIEVPVNNGSMPYVFNVADPRVLSFLRDVLDEVMSLFPSDVIHVGGDEVVYDHWQASSQVSSLMKEKGLATYGDLQVDFTNGISQYLSANGRRMMGWNDILGADIHDWQDGAQAQVSEKLAQNTIVHFWKGDNELFSRAANDGYDIVNAIHSQTYMDYPYNITSLRKAYHFDPIPKGLPEADQGSVIGTSSQVWTEFMPTPRVVESMVFPRLAAYAEVGWTEKEHMTYASFEQRMPGLVARWDAHDVNYDGQNLSSSWLDNLLVAAWTYVLEAKM